MEKCLVLLLLRLNHGAVSGEAPTTTTRWTHDLFSFLMENRSDARTDKVRTAGPGTRSSLVVPWKQTPPSYIYIYIYICNVELFTILECSTFIIILMMIVFILIVT